MGSVRLIKQVMRNNAYRFGGRRDEVLERDGFRCVECGMTQAEHFLKYGRDITVHHIDGNGRSKPKDQQNHSIDNMQTLCLRCHGSKDGKRSPGRRVTGTRLTNYEYNKRYRAKYPEKVREAHKLYMRRYRLLNKQEVL